METQVTFRMSRDVHSRVTAMAKQLGVKRSQVIRMALNEFLQHMEADQPRLFDRVQQLAGSVRSGVPDLGTRHREHLLEAIRRNDEA